MSSLHLFHVVKRHEIIDDEDLWHSITRSDVTLKAQFAFLVLYLDVVYM